jgi:hypothetical protein
MMRVQIRRMLALSGGVALALLTTACSTPVGPWVGAPSGTAQYASPGGGPVPEVACSGGMAYGERPCGSPWLIPR